MGVTLRYPYEVRKEEEYFDDIPAEKVPKDMLDLAKHIVETKKAHFEPELQNLLKASRLAFFQLPAVRAQLAAECYSADTRDWIKSKNPSAPAVKREAEEGWGR
jgi:hypothetical protein